MITMIRTGPGDMDYFISHWLINKADTKKEKRKEIHK